MCLRIIKLEELTFSAKYCYLLHPREDQEFLIDWYRTKIPELKIKPRTWLQKLFKDHSQRWLIPKGSAYQAMWLDESLQMLRKYGRMGLGGMAYKAICEKTDPKIVDTWIIEQAIIRV